MKLRIQPHDPGVHLYWVDFSSCHGLNLQGWVTEEERLEFGEFLKASDRHKRLVARAFLRYLAAHHLDVQPRAISYERDAWGKLHFAEAINPDRWEFNLSYTQGGVFFAFTQHGSIGVDIEDTAQDIEAIEIARDFFHPIEYQEMLALSPPLQKRRFFQIWTAKEAFVKAVGRGLSYGLENFSISRVSSEWKEILRVHGEGIDGRNWLIIPIDVPPLCVATVAIRVSEEVC